MNGTERIATLLTYLSTIQAHLAKHRGLAGPFYLEARPDAHGANVVVQLDGYHRLSAVAGGLLTWADSLTDVTADMWRPKSGDTVHLSITGMAGGMSVMVYDAASFDPAVFADVAPGERRSTSLGQLRAWAIGAGVAA